MRRIHQDNLCYWRFSSPWHSRSGLMQLSELLPRIHPNDFTLTPTLLSLLAANLLTIVLAIAGNWDAAPIIFVYWAQSVIIGIFTVVTILSADTASIKEDMEKRRRDRGENITLDPRRIRNHKVTMGLFFAFHYGFFQLAYYSFFIQDHPFGTVDFTDTGIWLSCGIFFLNHLYSYFFYRNSERKGEEFINSTFIRPYFRTIPMHLIILFGAFVIVVLTILGIESTLPVLVVFLLLKTGADLSLHLWKHGWT